MCSIFCNRSARNRGFHSIWAVDTSQARVILCCIIASPGDFVVFASRAAARLSLELRNNEKFLNLKVKLIVIVWLFCVFYLFIFSFIYKVIVSTNKQNVTK